MTTWQDAIEMGSASDTELSLTFRNWQVAELIGKARSPLVGALAAIIADPDCCAASKAIARDALGGVPPSHCIVPRKPTFEMKLAGATVITKEMMEAMANYDAADACWGAMVATAQVAGEYDLPKGEPA